MVVLFLCFAYGADAKELDLSISQHPLWANQPDVVAFERTCNDNLAGGQRSIDTLIAVKGARTIGNTLAPYDDAVRQINNAAYFSGLMQQVHPDAAFRDRATAMHSKAIAVQNALSLNRDVYDALSNLNVSKADSATRYYVQRTLRDFRLAGVDKNDATRARLKKLWDDLAEQRSIFDRNISDNQKIVEVTNATELEGLPSDYIENHKPGADGKIHITTNHPDEFPVLLYAKSNDLRRRVWEAFYTRAYPQNHDALMRMMQIRYEIATLLDYSSWADWKAADRMISKGQNIADFIGQIDAASRPLAQREFAMLLEEKRKTVPNAKEIFDYEQLYLEELTRRSKYNFDSQSVRPYLPYKQVKQGILDAAAALFHVKFRREQNVPAWDPTVETWLVLDKGKVIGRFYLDMHPRAGKHSHGEMQAVLDGVRGKYLPEGILVCNFPVPTITDPGLMTYDDVETFFHEFGHLMHHILGGQQPWAGISGLTMEADFGEAPSEMLEEWIRSPQVLVKLARHYKTGKPIPAKLVAEMNRASAFGRAAMVARQIHFAAISYDIYKTKPENIDLDAVCIDDVRRYTLFTPLPNVHEYASFGHLATMSSAVYTYLWDMVIAEDFFQQFDSHNLLGGDAPLRYRKLVLEPGGSMSANDLVKNFLGRPQTTAALQRWMEEEFSSIPKETNADEQR